MIHTELCCTSRQNDYETLDLHKADVHIQELKLVGLFHSKWLSQKLVGIFFLHSNCLGAYRQRSSWQTLMVHELLPDCEVLFGHSKKLKQKPGNLQKSVAVSFDQSRINSKP